MLKFSCHHSYIMHISFCRTNQKNVLQKVIKDWHFEVYLLTGEPSQFWFLLSDLIVDLMRGSWIFCQTERFRL